MSKIQINYERLASSCIEQFALDVKHFSTSFAPDIKKFPNNRTSTTEETLFVIADRQHTRTPEFWL